MPTSAQTSDPVITTGPFLSVALFDSTRGCGHPRSSIFEHPHAGHLPLCARQAQAGVETNSSNGRTLNGSALPLADNSKAGPVTTAGAT